MVRHHCCTRLDAVQRCRLAAHRQRKVRRLRACAMESAMMGSEEKAAWLSERCGCLTASRMKDAMDFLKNGEPSQARTKYMFDLLAERLTGDSVPHYVNDAMQRGLDLEDEM